MDRLALTIKYLAVRFRLDNTPIGHETEKDIPSDFLAHEQGAILEAIDFLNGLTLSEVREEIGIEECQREEEDEWFNRGYEDAKDAKFESIL